MLNLTSEQLGRLIFKARHEPRRNQKRFLKDLGGEGSAEELDRVLMMAESVDAAIRECERLERHRLIVAKTVDAGVDGRVAEMLAEIRLKMQDQGLTQAEIGDRCGWPQAMVSAYLSGTKEPGIGNLAKLATAVGCVWRLESSPIE